MIQSYLVCDACGSQSPPVDSSRHLVREHANQYGFVTRKVPGLTTLQDFCPTCLPQSYKNPTNYTRWHEHQPHNQPC